MKEIIIKQDESGRRLDKFLIKYFNKAPVSSIYKLLRKKRIKLNGSKAAGSEIVKSGDTLQFYLSDETLDNFMESRIIKKTGRIDIVYEDENVLLVNKPSGLISHSSEKAGEDTLIERILYYLYSNGCYKPDKESSFTPALCNRLDRNTSGIVICGKNLRTVQLINEAIAAGSVDKYYIAVVKGRVDKPGTLRGFHVKDQRSNVSNILNIETDGSKQAVTEYEPVVKSTETSILRIKLVTGRSHQIRVHMSSIGHPIIGDIKYGDERINKDYKHKYGIDSQLLHAEKIRFNCMADELEYLSKREFAAIPPAVFGQIMNDARL